MWSGFCPVFHWSCASRSGRGSLLHIFNECLICRQGTGTGSVWLAVLCDRAILVIAVRDRSIGDILVPYLPCTAIHGCPSLLGLSRPQNSGLTPMVPDASARISAHSIFYMTENRPLLYSMGWVVQSIYGLGFGTAYGGAWQVLKLLCSPEMRSPDG